MTEQAMIERVARAIVRHRIDVANQDTLEGYGIPFGAAADLQPAVREAAEAAAIDQAWPAWRVAARSIIEAMREPIEPRNSGLGESRAPSPRAWQIRTIAHDRRVGDRRKAQ